VSDSPLTEERGNELVTHAMLTVFAIADRAPERLPSLDDLGDINGSEWWGMTCSVLEVISRLMPQHDDRVIAVEQIKTTGDSIESRGFRLAAQLVATYGNGDPNLALDLWRAADRDVADKAVAEVYSIAGLLVREHPGRVQ
jgi:hypothetical protein